MNTAVINFKTDPLVKKRAQKRAKQLGLSLSSIINACLRDFVNNPSVHVLESPKLPDSLLETIQEMSRKKRQQP